MGRTKAGKPKNPGPKAAFAGFAGLPPGVDTRILEMNPEEIEALIARMQRVILDPDDLGRLTGLIALVGCLAAELRSKRTTISRLAALMFGDPSEKTAKVCPPKDGKKPDPPAEPWERKPGHGRNGAAAFPGSAKVKVPHESLKDGDECLECPNGRVYPMAKPAVLVRIVGMSPLQARVTELEPALQRLRRGVQGPGPRGHGPAQVR